MTSRAVQYARYGGPEVLEIVDLPDPHPVPGQVRIAVHAAGVNFRDVIVALETFEHIDRPEVLTILAAIAKMAPRRFICSVPVEVGPAVAFKNLASALIGYIRHRDYTWRDTFWASVYRLDKVPVHNRRHIGFDWRWLAYSVRLFLPAMRRHNLPFWFLPAALSNSVLLVADCKPSPENPE